MKITLPTVALGRSVLSNLEEGLSLEWVVANGLGGYASSTALGVNTRKYHGLLVSSFNPPVDRRVALSKADEQDSNLAIKYDTVATAIQGEGKVQSVKLKNVKSGREEDYQCNGVFIFVGMVPNTDFLKGFVELTGKGFIKCDCAHLRTSVPGVFVAGDCRIGAAMQLVTAVADGVNAAMMLKEHFRDPKWWNEPVSDSLQPGGW